jgi:hypothetical protein
VELVAELPITVVVAAAPTAMFEETLDAEFELSPLYTAVTAKLPNGRLNVLDAALPEIGTVA